MDFSLIGWDPIVSPLLAGLVELIVVDGKYTFIWGDGVKTNFADYIFKRKICFFNFSHETFPSIIIL